MECYRLQGHSRCYRRTGFRDCHAIYSTPLGFERVNAGAVYPVAVMQVAIPLGRGRWLFEVEYIIPDGHNRHTQTASGWAATPRICPRLWRIKTPGTPRGGNTNGIRRWPVHGPPKRKTATTVIMNWTEYIAAQGERPEADLTAVNAGRAQT